MHYEKFQDGTVKCIEDEIPFEVPKGWAWSRLSSIATIVTGRLDANAQREDGDYPFFTCGEEVFRTNTFAFDCDAILLGGNNAVGDFKIHRCCGKFNAYQRVYVITPYGEIYPDYLYYHIKYYLPALQKQSIGSQTRYLKLGMVNDLLIACPPACEQRDITLFTNKYFDLCTSIETNKCEIKNMISLMKSTILDLAIRGQLVPQNLDDEPASVLLERIRVEKEELIKQGKIKRDKKESVIFKGEDNSYYEDIPKNWVLTTLSELTHPLILNDGDWILSENMSSNGSVKLIRLGSIGEMQYVDKGFKYITEETFTNLRCTEIHSGYILINRIINEKMNICILPNIEGKLITAVDACWISPNNNYNLKYIMYALSSPTVQLQILLKATGTTRKRISKHNLINIPIPFPPLDEQNRIVEVIEKSFTQLNKMINCLI